MPSNTLSSAFIKKTSRHTLTRSLGAKKWLIFLPMAILTFMLAWLFSINILVDPYSEYQIFSHSLNKHKYFTDRETSPVLLAQKLTQKPYALVFGTSRSNHISEEHLNQDVLNFSSSLYGRPSDVNYFLQNLSNQQRSNITEIYYLIDLSCFIPSTYDTNPAKREPSYYFKTIKSLGRLKLLRAISTLLRNGLNQCGYYINDNGSVVTSEFAQYYPTNEERIANKNKFVIECHDEALNDLSFINAYCKEHNIHITYFTDIFNICCLEHLKFETLVPFFTKIVDTIPSLYSMMYLPNYSENMSYFYDRDHHKDELTKLQCEILQSPEKIKEFLVNKENVSTYLNTLKEKIKHAP